MKTYAGLLTEWRFREDAANTRRPVLFSSSQFLSFFISYLIWTLLPELNSISFDLICVENHVKEVNVTNTEKIRQLNDCCTSDLYRNVFRSR